MQVAAKTEELAAEITRKHSNNNADQYFIS